MNIFKHSDNTELYGLDGLSEDELIANYSMCLNYRAYIQSIINLPDSALLSLAPGLDAKSVRSYLRLQEKYCTDFIDLWNSVIHAGGTKNLQN